MRNNHTCTIIYCKTKVHNKSASSSAATNVITKTANFFFIVKYWCQFVAAADDAELICTIVSKTEAGTIISRQHCCKYNDGICRGTWRCIIFMYHCLRSRYRYDYLTSNAAVNTVLYTTNYIDSSQILLTQKYKFKRRYHKFAQCLKMTK